MLVPTITLSLLAWKPNLLDEISDDYFLKMICLVILTPPPYIAHCQKCNQPALIGSEGGFLPQLSWVNESFDTVDGCDLTKPPSQIV